MKLDSILRYLFFAITALKVLIILFIPEFRVWEPEEMALNLLAGKGFYVDFLNQHNYNYQFPLYPAIIYLIYSVFGPIQQIVIVFNILIFSAAALYLGKLLHVLINQVSTTAVWILSLIVLVYPAANVYVVGNIHPFALDLLLCISGFYYGIQWAKTYTKSHLALLFLILSMILIDRITLIVAPAIGLIWGFVQSKSKLQHFIYIAVFGSFALLPLAGWMHSTYAHNHRISIMSSTGVNLWIGIQRETEGTAQLSNGDTYLSLLSAEEIAQLEKLAPLEQNDFFTAKYWEERTANPALFSQMLATKLRNFWWFRTDLGVDYNAVIKSLVLLYKVVYALLLGLMIYGLVKAPKAFWTVACMMLGISLFQAWFYVETRHRVLLEPFMVLIAFYALNEIIERFKLNKQTTA